MSVKPSPIPEAPAWGGRLGAWWRGASRAERFHRVLVVVAILLGAGLPLLLATWWVEDAAISFAYAKHLAAGEGLVPYPGGERVEGYSNPLWVFLLAGFYLVGIDGFLSSKLLAAFLGAGAVWATWGIARELREEDDIVPPLAALLLAVNPQFVIWNASGLENSLFSFLLALGIHRLLLEARGEGWPWSSLAFLGLALTRPEGPLYAAAGAFWFLVATLAAGRGMAPGLKWIATFSAPFAAYHAARYAYFAWPLPNTYYAKLGDGAFEPYDWGWRGWNYLRRYAQELGQGWLLPAYVAGAVGLSRWRRHAVVALVVLLAVVLLYPGPDQPLLPLGLPELPAPEAWTRIRVWILFAVGGILPFLAVRGGQGWLARALCGSLVVVGLAFTLRAGGDWMRGFRWFALIAVPMTVLLAAGLGSLADEMGRRLPSPARLRPALDATLARGWGLGGAVVALAIVLGAAIPGFLHLDAFQARPETSPAQVHRRVAYMNHVAERLHLDHVVNLEVDMGATMYGSGHELVDIAGLLDVPMAQHDYARPFIREYLFEERRPHFAHLHGPWERRMGVRQIPEYPRTYFEIDPYPTSSRTVHPGNRVRRDLLVASEWGGPPGRRVAFEGDLVFHGHDVPLGEAGQDRHLHLQIGVERTRRRAAEVRALAFLSDGEARRVWELPLGYDWFTAEDARPGEVILGTFALPIGDLTPGTWDLGFVFLGPDGVLAPLEGPPEEAPVYARGEVLWPEAVRVLSPEEDDTRLAADHAALEAEAAALRCEEAEGGWDTLRARRTGDRTWREGARPGVARALAICWIGRAEAAESREERVEALARARWWDHRAPGLAEAAGPVADALYQEGLEARLAQDWEAAYRLFSDVLRVDATRAWARRGAEEARAFRLGLDPETRAEREAERARRVQERQERLRRGDE